MTDITYHDHLVGPYRCCFKKDVIVTDQLILDKLNERHPENSFTKAVVIPRGIWLATVLDGVQYDKQIEVQSFEVYYEIRRD